MKSGWRQRAATIIVPLVVLALGLAVRLSPWEHVFTDRGVRLRADTDPHYHVLRAERLLKGAPGAPWRDPALGWPTGAAVPWPPLFDAILAAAGSVTASNPDRDDLARAASFVPVVLAVFTLVLLAALARRLLSDRGTAWSAVAIAALLPALAQHGELGRPDQHGAELFLFVAILLTHLIAAQGEARSARAAMFGLAGLVAVSFWTWMGSAVLLATPIAFAAAWHALATAGDPSADRAARALCLGGLGGAALLAVSLLLLGPPGALGSTAATGVTGLHVAIAAGAGVAGGLLLLANRFRRAAPSRLRLGAEAILAPALPAVAALAISPALRGGTAQGLVALLASNPWYKAIGEFAPLFPGEAPLGDEVLAAVLSLGLTLPAALLAAAALRSRWRAGARREVVFLLVLAGLFVPLTFARQRFMGYAAIPLALLGAEGLRWLAERTQGLAPGQRWLRGLVLVLGVAVITGPARPWAANAPWSGVSDADEEALRWLGQAPAPDGRPGVMSQWSLGHAIQYFAKKPVVASPFGTEGGPHAMKDWAGFWYARDPFEAEHVLVRCRIGFVVLQDPVSELVGDAGLAPMEVRADLPRVRTLQGSSQVELTAASFRFVPLQLYANDGRMLPNGRPALSAYRLVFESAPSERDRSVGASAVKVYAVGPGATLRVTGAGGGAIVEATVDVRTNRGRQFQFRTQATADAGGRAETRLPYASGWNGATWAGPWSVRAGHLAAQVRPTEADVGSGADLSVRLTAGAR